jgi:hypothetical protein
MSSPFPPLRFQILSDLHLETPLSSPSYDHFSLASAIPISAPNLLLLGDIGLAKHPQLFTFLAAILDHSKDTRIFYVLGNHEAYGTTLELAIQKFTDFEKTADEEYGEGRFVLMNRRRLDLNDTVTLLGCTLWTHIPPPSAHACATLLKDFDDTSGIWDRSVHDHNADHDLDLAWLNAQVSQIAATVPHRSIAILTHHSSTIDARANEARHARSRVNEGFRTDLSAEVCWRSPRVKMWAFGHTHFDCQFYDGVEAEGDGEGRMKLVVANQKGYGVGKERERVETVVVAGTRSGRLLLGKRRVGLETWG